MNVSMAERRHKQSQALGKAVPRFLSARFWNKQMNFFDAGRNSDAGEDDKQLIFYMA